MRIVGFILAIVLVWFGAKESIGALLSIEAFCLVVGLAVWGFVGAAGPMTWPSLKVAFSGATPVVPDLRAGFRALRTARFTTLAAGLAAAVVGMVLVLMRLSDPAQIGPGMSLALTGLLYAVFIAYFVLLPLEASVQRRLATLGGAEKETADTALDLVVLGGGLGLTALSVGLLLVAFRP